MALEQDIAKLTQAANRLTTSVDNKIGDINRQLEIKKSEVDKTILSMAESLAAPIISYYDNTRHSKKSLNITADPSDPTKSKWVQVPTSSAGYLMYPAEGRLTKVYTTYGWAEMPGHFEKPQYSRDTSFTLMEFVLANSQANSEKINARLTELGLKSHLCGGWWEGAKVYDANAINIAGLHVYSRLWVRFVNVGHKGPAQNVIEFGGNSRFQVERVVNYPKIQGK